MLRWRNASWGYVMCLAKARKWAKMSARSKTWWNTKKGGKNVNPRWQAEWAGTLGTVSSRKYSKSPVGGRLRDRPTDRQIDRQTDGRADNNDWWHKAPAVNAINTHRRHITGMRSPSPSPRPSIMYYRCAHTHTHRRTYYMRMYNAWTRSWACLWRTWKINAGRNLLNYPNFITHQIPLAVNRCPCTPTPPPPTHTHAHPLHTPRWKTIKICIISV